jgi:hypothetical protein
MTTTPVKEDVEVKSVSLTDEVSWVDDSNNPWNWPGKKKALNLSLFSIASLAV